MTRTTLIGVICISSTKDGPIFFNKIDSRTWEISCQAELRVTIVIVRCIT